MVEDLSDAASVGYSGGASSRESKETRRIEIAQMRQLARAALGAYNIAPRRLTLLVHMYNTTFRVDTDRGENYVLRVCRVGVPTIERIGSELLWLAALRRDTELEVPDPVPTRSGSLLTVASTDSLPPHICVLFRWMRGRQLRRGLTPPYMERVGALMAHLHNHALGWELPAGFVRGKADSPLEATRGLPDPFAPEVTAKIVRLVARAFSEEDAARVAPVLNEVRNAEQALGAIPGNFALIHADLHFRNLLFSGDTVRAIDFDDCGFGPLLYDPAVMLSELRDWAAYPALREGLLAGYERVRPLPAGYEAYVDTFIALRGVQDKYWDLAWPDKADSGR